MLKGGGTAFLNVPVYYSIEQTLEDPVYNTPELRKKYYGQSDHVRKYGTDYIEHLRAAGFRVEKIDYASLCTPEERRLYSLPEPMDMAAEIYCCKK